MKPQTHNPLLDTDAFAQDPERYTQSLDAKALRDLPENAPILPISRNDIYLILDGVYDTYNIGGLFRLADALACQHMYLTGASETPPNPRIKKASIGTYKVVPWSYHTTAIEAIQHLRTHVENVAVIAIEQDTNARSYTTYTYQAPVAFVVGSETHGVSAETLACCDGTVDIPMLGYNKSLNVIVSAGIVAYLALSQLKK